MIRLLDKMNVHGIFGYSDTKEEYFEALSGWLKRRHNWEIREEWLVKTPGIVFALAMAVKAFTKESEAVLIQQPVYYPFTEVVEDNNRKLVISELRQNVEGGYCIDYEEFENKIVAENVKLFFLCNPHNPGGRVWTREELQRLGDICLKHHVLIVSDEIHAEFTEQFLKEKLPKVKMTELEGTYLVWLDFREYK